VEVLIVSRALLILAMLWPFTATGATDIPVLTYHDIVARRGGDAFAVTREEFRAHLAYLKHEGYTPVSLATLVRAGRGEAALPDKPVVLTFDDGLTSYAAEAVPLLREYGYPSVLSIVTAWVDGQDTPVQYRGRLLSWDQLRALAAAPLIEIISHSHDLHRGIVANPQGDEAPAGNTRAYGGAGRYESETNFRARIRADLERSQARIVQELKLAPIAIAWPYGAYEQVTIEEATRVGMRLHLTLDGRPTKLADLPRINRMTFHKYRRLADLDDMLTFRRYRTEQLRFVQIELGDWAGKPAAEQERMLSALLERVELLGVNAVIIVPLTRDRRSALFQTDAMPASADLLNHVLLQLRRRGRIDQRYLRLPAPIDGVDVTRVYADMARLNRFSGVVLDGKLVPAERQHLVERLRYHQPAVKVGVVGGDDAPPGADFLLVELEPAGAATLQSRAQALLVRNGTPAYFLLQRAPTTEDAQLYDAMRALRAAGVRHYGYTNDDFLGDSPNLLRTVTELRAHTVVSADAATQPPEGRR
jgi:peptidoglycan/xylan/chitin deacetylase (PgdA/CDA1 family)